MACNLGEAYGGVVFWMYTYIMGLSICCCVIIMSMSMSSVV